MTAFHTALLIELKDTTMTDLTYTEAVTAETAARVKAMDLLAVAIAPDANLHDQLAYEAAKREYETARRMVRAMIAMGRGSE